MPADDEPGRPPILVVDDHEAIRALYARAFQRAGYDVLQAGGPSEAFRILADTTVLALLIDNSMPGMSGIEVIERVRAEEGTATLPIVLVTGSEEPSDRARGMAAGASDYVPKTARLRDLVDRVGEIIEAHGN
jgi:two-component system phosphate regulon response regulator PhoB